MISSSDKVSTPTVLSAFLADALRVFLDDRDVSEVRANDAGDLHVVRRGRWERLQADLEPEIFDVLHANAHAQLGVDAHALGDSQPTITVDLPRAELYWRQTTGRGVLWCQKHPPYDVTIDEFVDSGLVKAEVAEDILSHAAGGGGCVVLGPARYHIDRWVVALARALSAHRWLACAKSGAEIPWAEALQVTDSDWGGSGQRPLAHGIEGIFTWGLEPKAFLSLCQARLGTLGVYGVRVASLEQLLDGLESSEASFSSAATQACVFMQDGQGSLRLVTQRFGSSLDQQSSRLWLQTAQAEDDLGRHSAERSASPPSRGAASAFSTATVPPRKSVASGSMWEDPFDGLPPLEPLPPGPPNAWASTSPDDDPGWELGGQTQTEDALVSSAAMHEEADSSPGVHESDDASKSGFADVMSQVRARPTFQPRPPAPHPLARKLQTDPFGGLTLEPPAGENKGGASDPFGDTTGAQRQQAERRSGSEDHLEPRKS